MGLIIRRSRIHQAGMFTTERIRKGKRIVEYSGERISSAEADRVDTRRRTYLFGLSDGKTVIYGSGPAALINHSCEPNCEAVEVDGRVWILALRSIAPGEELTYDYNLYDGEGDVPCHCGAAKCRGTMYAPPARRRRLERRRGRARRKSGRKSGKRAV